MEDDAAWGHLGWHLPREKSFIPGATRPSRKVLRAKYTGQEKALSFTPPMSKPSPKMRDIT